MLQPVAANLWHVQHSFKASGLTVSSRMSVVRLQGGRLWLHSPVPLGAALSAELAALGRVAYVIAPNKSHHLFVGDYSAAYPDADIYCAPGLGTKQSDLVPMPELSATPEPGWQEDIDQTIFRGLPIINEAVFFHRPSRTLILTDLCQWMHGELPLATTLFARATGVRGELAMPRSLKLFVTDRRAARESCDHILSWPFERVIVAHDVILDQGAHDAVEKALAWLRT